MGAFIDALCLPQLLDQSCRLVRSRSGWGADNDLDIALRLPRGLLPQCGFRQTGLQETSQTNAAFFQNAPSRIFRKKAVCHPGEYTKALGAGLANVTIRIFRKEDDP